MIDRSSTKSKFTTAIKNTIIIFIVFVCFVIPPSTFTQPLSESNGPVASSTTSKHEESFSSRHPHLEGILRFLEVIIDLAWPVLVAVLLWRLYPVLHRIFESRSFAIKVAGIDVSVQAASDQLAKQIQDLQEKVLLLELRTANGSSRSDSPFQGRTAGGLANRPDVIEAQAEPSTRLKHVLWVDDNPSNNAYLMDKLRKDGVEVTEALSTKEALQVLKRDQDDIDAIISDMGRVEDGTYRSDAGLKLISSIRDLAIPSLVFSTARYARQHHEQVKKVGGHGATSSSFEVLAWLKQLGRAKPNH